MSTEQRLAAGLGRFLRAFPDRERFAEAYVEALQPHTDMAVRDLPIVQAEDYLSWFPFEEIAAMLKLFQSVGLARYPHMLTAQLQHEALVADVDEWCMATELWEGMGLAFCFFTIDYNLQTMRSMAETGLLPNPDGNLFSETECIPSQSFIQCWEALDAAGKERFAGTLWRWFGRSGHCLFSREALLKTEES